MGIGKVVCYMKILGQQNPHTMCQVINNKTAIMKKQLLPVLLCFVFAKGFAQQQRKPTGYLLFQYNQTIYDQTLGNNPWGIGIGFQAFLNNRATFTPTIELTADLYLADDKVARINSDSLLPKIYNTVRGMTNLCIGYSFHPTPNFYLSFSAGSSLINGEILAGIKPSLGFHLSKNKKWTGKASYINVFARTNTPKKDFGSYSVAIGYKLF